VALRLVVRSGSAPWCRRWRLLRGASDGRVRLQVPANRAASKRLGLPGNT